VCGGVIVVTNYRWLRESDLNQRPSGYEPDELPGCSIPRWFGDRRFSGQSSGHLVSFEWTLLADC
jgi:hypothetical protein